MSDALQANVTNGVLTLTTHASFATSQPIKARRFPNPWCPIFCWYTAGAAEAAP